MAASHLRADMFAEFISSQQEKAVDRQQQKHRSGITPVAATTSDAASTHPNASQTDTSESNTPRSWSFKQEQPLLKILLLLQHRGGSIPMKALLKDLGLSTLDTVRQLDELKQAAFVEIITTETQETVRLTELGCWAAKYANE